MIRPGKASTKAGPRIRMKPALTTRSGDQRTDGLEQGRVPASRDREVGRRQVEGRDAGQPRARSRAGSPATSLPTADDLGVDAAVGAGVDEGLQQRAGAGGEHHEAGGHTGTLSRRTAHRFGARQTMGSWLNWRYMCAVKRHANGSVMSVRMPEEQAAEDQHQGVDDRHDDRRARGSSVTAAVAGLDGVADAASPCRGRSRGRAGAGTARQPRQDAQRQADDERGIAKTITNRMNLPRYCVVNISENEG